MACHHFEKKTFWFFICDNASYVSNWDKKNITQEPGAHPAIGGLQVWGRVNFWDFNIFVPWKSWMVSCTLKSIWIPKKSTIWRREKTSEDQEIHMVSGMGTTSKKSLVSNYPFWGFIMFLCIYNIYIYISSYLVVVEGTDLAFGTPSYQLCYERSKQKNTRNPQGGPL